MSRAIFETSHFYDAARGLVSEIGPAAVTVDAITQRLKAPKGSFYHRFESRDSLLGDIWLQALTSFQEGFFAAIESGDGLAAALHTPRWSRSHLEDACLLLLYNRKDFVQGDWPAKLKLAVQERTAAFENALKQFSRQAFGRAGASQIRRATYILAEAPVAAVKGHLQRREAPPAIVDDLVTCTYRAIVEYWDLDKG